MNGCRPHVLWQRHPTTPPGPSLRRATRGFSSPYGDRRDLSRGCGRLRFRSRDRRRESSGTRGSALSWFSTPSCRRWRNSWWKCRQCSRFLRLWWSILLLRPQCSKLPRQLWSILHPRQQLFQHFRLSWSTLHPRVQLSNRRCLSPAVFQSPSPVVEFVAPAPALSEASVPGVEFFSPVPVLSRWLAPGVDHFSPAPSVSHAARGRGLQGSVSGQSSTSRRRYALPLPSGWRREEDVSGRVYYWHVHTRQTRWTPPGSIDDDEDEEDEEEEDEDMDEIYAESRFPAGFLPMGMCRWFPSGNCRQGWGCMFAHSVSELHPQALGQGP